MKIRLMALIGLILLFTIAPSQAAHKHLEKEYQAAWCEQRGGATEYRLDDGARVDCLTDEYAVEFDFGPKWAESIGQALFYGLKTDRTPGVVLIIEKKAQRQFIDRLEAVSETYGIKVWTMTPEDLK